jgi:hypothetical protein
MRVQRQQSYTLRVIMRIRRPLRVDFHNNGSSDRLLVDGDMLML